MRRLLFAFLVLVALAAVALFAAWRDRVVWAQRALDEALRRVAIPGAAATLAGVELDGLRLREVALGTEPIFRADELLLESPWPQLRAGRVAAVTVRDAELRVRLEDEGLLLGSLEPWLASSAAEPASGPPMIPIDRVTLEHLSLAVDGDLGPLRVGVDGELRVVERGRVEAGLDLVVDRDGSLIAGRLEAEAIHSEGDWQGRGELSVPETQIDSAWLSLAPGFQDVLKGVRGRAAANVDFTVGAEGVASQMDLALAGIDLRTSWGRIEGIAGTLRIDGPDPLRTPPGQLLAIRRIDMGLPLLDGLIEFQLSPDGTSDVQRATWSWAGGTIQAAGAWQPDSDSSQVTLHADELDLGTLL
ncbi:MAG: hypothetical protein GY946_02365, partial [bacterium]|nr:hypothetical protein [bacterium]